MQITKTHKILVSGVLGGLLLLSMEGCSNFRVPGFTNNEETCYQEGSYYNTDANGGYYNNSGYSNYMAVQHPYWTPYDDYANYNNQNYRQGYSANAQDPQQWQYLQNVQYAPARYSSQPQQQYPVQASHTPTANTGQYCLPAETNKLYYSYALPAKEENNHFWFDRLGNKKQRN